MSDESRTLGKSAHADRKTKLTVAAWPRLLDIHLSAVYGSVGESTVRDWIADGLLKPVAMPGSILRDKRGCIVAHGRNRRIAKVLIDRADLDSLIDSCKRGEL